MTLTLRPPDKSSPKKEQTSKFSLVEVKVLSAIEQIYYETAKIATPEIISQHTNIRISAVKDALANPEFIEALQKRGIDLENPSDLSVLTPVQLALANLLLNIHDKTSLRQKLEVLGVSTQQYNAWLRNPAYQQYLRKRAEETFKAADSEAYMGLVKAVSAGDVKAISLFFEMRGIYNPRVTVDVNIELILAQVVDIVTRHVTDPKTLTAIATEMEQLNTGSNK